MSKSKPSKEELDQADLEVDLIAWEVTDWIDRNGGAR